MHTTVLPLLFSSPPVVLLSGRASLSASAFTVSLLLSADDDKPKSRSSSATQVSRCCSRRCLMVGSRAGIGAPGVKVKSEDSRNRLTCRGEAVFLVVAAHFVKGDEQWRAPCHFCLRYTLCQCYGTGNVGCVSIPSLLWKERHANGFIMSVYLTPSSVSTYDGS